MGYYNIGDSGMSNKNMGNSVMSNSMWRIILIIIMKMKYNFSLKK